ncbi:hypothetical protein [Ureibacillus manganicus]|uniref:Uncharacterized protein n=1 Tax=Ureibacillus manganicus DSM 26584 TaxID=1384049 RepID=A0A0A3I5S7_9BACL|nr:hypothetical protein [Ureibacillus manganicus]KGR78053.1 hypothetical protein CD29_12940 [Ureibacillus manganicus DSM 26584]
MTFIRGMKDICVRKYSKNVVHKVDEGHLRLEKVIIRQMKTVCGRKSTRKGHHKADEDRL